jgi:hypothetical protein
MNSNIYPLVAAFFVATLAAAGESKWVAFDKNGPGILLTPRASRPPAVNHRSFLGKGQREATRR